MNEPKVHHEIFEIPLQCVERRLPLVSFSYPCVLQISNFVNTVVPWRGSKADNINARGYLFFLVTGEEEGWMIPAARDSLMYVSVVSISEWQVAEWLVGWGAPGRRTMGQWYGRWGGSSLLNTSPRQWYSRGTVDRSGGGVADLGESGDKEQLYSVRHRERAPAGDFVVSPVNLWVMEP